MKKVFVILLSLIMILSFASCSNSAPTNSTSSSEQSGDSTETETYEDTKNVKNKEMTLEFSFGTKTGKYTGPLNDNGLPEGQGSFVSENSQGTKWTYTGEFVNGQFEGEGKTEWEGGYFERGTYHNGELEPLALTNSLFTK